MNACPVYPTFTFLPEDFCGLCKGMHKFTRSVILKRCSADNKNIRLLKAVDWVWGGRHCAETDFVLPPPSNFRSVEIKKRYKEYFLT
jgi:hypothetical protein